MFWSFGIKHQWGYLVLAKLAPDLLTILVSIVASKSAFSLCGKMISTTCSFLKSKIVQALVCLQDWRQADRKRLVNNHFEMTEDEEEDNQDPFFS